MNNEKRLLDCIKMTKQLLKQIDAAGNLPETPEAEVIHYLTTAKSKHLTEQEINTLKGDN